MTEPNNDPIDTDKAVAEARTHGRQVDLHVGKANEHRRARDRALISLRAAGWSYNEIAAATEQNRNTVVTITRHVRLDEE